MDNKERARKISEYWNSQAKKYKEDMTATLFDTRLMELEIETIMKLLSKNDKVIDVGCGNGYTTLMYADKVNDILGVDYCKEMVDVASAAAKKKGQVNAHFEHVSILDNPTHPAAFDKAISTRVIINIVEWKDQMKAIQNIAKYLKPKGRFIFCESTKQGLERLNDIRKMFGLECSPITWHNEPFDEDKLYPFLEKHFKIVEKKTFGMYYFISRVIHPLLVAPEEPKWGHKINEVAKRVASKIPEFKEASYLTLLILEKKD